MLIVALQRNKKLKTSLKKNQIYFSEMALNVSMTPVMTKVDCNVPKCNKTLKNQKNLNSHMEKVHKVVLSITQSPIANTVRTLFGGENKEALPSTQGNSSGAVNYHKVMSGGYFQCGDCEKEFSIKNDLTEHMKVHDNADNADDDKEGEKELETITEDLEFEIVAKKVENLVLVDKIVDKFVENAYKAMNPDEESDQVECHECFCKDQVIENYVKLIDEKATCLFTRLERV